MRFTRALWTIVVAIAFVISACADDATAPSGLDRGLESAGKKGGEAVSTDAEAAIVQMVRSANANLASKGVDYRIGVAEYLTAGDEQGRTLFFADVGNKQLGHHFIPDDPRRAWSPPGSAISYVVDQTDGAAPPLDTATTTAAIDRAMATWEDQSCSELPIVKVQDFGVPLGILSGSPFLLADVTHAGWLPLPPPTLGVTFTFLFCDPCGANPVFTDLDGNGKLDAAFREIYYSTSYPWADDGTSSIDVETVALHEAGHGLSQGHFGKLFRTDKNGKFHFAPRSVMNAGYTGPQRDLRGTDNGGHCSIWGSWPN